MTHGMDGVLIGGLVVTAVGHHWLLANYFAGKRQELIARGHGGPNCRARSQGNGTRQTVACRFKARGFLIAANQPNTSWTSGTEG